MGEDRAGRGQRGDRGAILAWCLYDFGNSAFTTVVVTFVYSAFFTKRFAADENAGTALWSRAVTVSALIVALLSPVMGAVADRGGRRKALLLATTVVCVAATAALEVVPPGLGLAWAALAIFTVANVAYEMGCALYNAFLPDLAPPDALGRVSGYGWALGYVGGILALLLVLPLVAGSVPPFGLDKESGQHVRVAMWVAAAWFAVFSIPIFVRVREDRSRASPPGTPLVRAAFGQLLRTLHEVRRYRQVVRFLLARLVYNDGLVTVFGFGAIYATGTFGFTVSKLVGFGILLNVTAALGAVVFARWDDRLGGKRTILVTLGALSLATLAAVLTADETVFWVAAALLGVFVGPNQSASRALMGRFVPKDMESEFYGFFAFSGKATAFLGPLLLGTLTEAFDSQRAGFAVVIAFFVVGGLLLLGVDEAAGREAARVGLPVSPTRS